MTRIRRGVVLDCMQVLSAPYAPLATVWSFLPYLFADPLAAMSLVRRLFDCADWRRGTACI